MKKLIPILAIAALLSACQKPHEKAVNDYINANFDDPSSYERVKLSNPQEYTVALYYMEQVRARGKAEGWSADSIFNKTMEIRPYLEKEGEDPDMVLSHFVEHTYRVNNKYGSKELHKEKWYLNDDLSQVTSIDPI